VVARRANISRQRIAPIALFASARAGAVSA
jgi:hypothetical protein